MGLTSLFNVLFEISRGILAFTLMHFLYRVLNFLSHLLFSPLGIVARGLVPDVAKDAAYIVTRWSFHQEE